MDDLDEFDDLHSRLEDNITLIRNEATKALKAQDEAKALSRINALLDPQHPQMKRSQDLVCHYEASLREFVGDSGQKSELVATLGAYQTDLKNVVTKLSTRKEDLSRSLLMPSTAPAARTADQIDDKTKTVIKATENLQKEDISRVQDMNRLAVGTIQIGEETLTEIHRQAEVLDGAEQDLWIIREDIKTSRQLIKAIQKELQKDKCIRLGCFIFLTIGLILVIWAAIDPTFGAATSNAGGDGIPSTSDRLPGQSQVPSGVTFAPM